MSKAEHIEYGDPGDESDFSDPVKLAIRQLQAISTVVEFLRLTQSSSGSALRILESSSDNDRQNFMG